MQRSRDDAVLAMRQRLSERTLADAPLYVGDGVLLPGELVLKLGELPTEPHAEGSWVGFADLAPDQSWAHPCLYLFADADGCLREIAASWYPLGWRHRFLRER